MGSAGTASRIAAGGGMSYGRHIIGGGIAAGGTWKTRWLCLLTWQRSRFEETTILCCLVKVKKQCF